MTVADAPSEKAGLEPGLSGVMRVADVAVLARAPSAAVDGRRWLAARDGTAEAREQRDGLRARQASHGRAPPGTRLGLFCPPAGSAPPRAPTRGADAEPTGPAAPCAPRSPEGGTPRCAPRTRPPPHSAAPGSGRGPTAPFSNRPSFGPSFRRPSENQLFFLSQYLHFHFRRLCRRTRYSLLATQHTDPVVAGRSPDFSAVVFSLIGDHSPAF